MKELTKNKFLIIIILSILPIIYVYLSELIIIINNNFVRQLLFLFAASIVVVTVYLLQLLVIKKYSNFMEKGIWGNNYFIMFIGALVLMFFVILSLFLFNNVPFNPFLQRFSTFLLAYPVVFVFIMMISAFYKGIIRETKEKILLISSFTVLIGIEFLMILLILSNPSF